MHNLKYFTWVEQLGKTVEELDAQWEDPDYWTSRFGVWRQLDDRIREFNERTGLAQPVSVATGGTSWTTSEAITSWNRRPIDARP